MRACVVAIAKDEGRFMAEWLAHHLALGFDHVFVFDNESSDDTATIVEAAGRKLPVTRIFWPSPSRYSPQTTAYNYALAKLAKRYEWVAFFDIDEFLVLKEDDSIQSFLQRFGPEVGAVAINWLSFGSAGKKNGDYGLVTDTFRTGGARTWENNRHIKTIARVSATRRAGVHVCDLRSGLYVHADGCELSMTKRRGLADHITHSVAQLNHYQLKSKADFGEKIKRGRAGKPTNDPTRFRQEPERFFSRHDKNECAYDEIDNVRDRRMAMLAQVTAAVSAIRTI